MSHYKLFVKSRGAQNREWGWVGVRGGGGLTVCENNFQHMQYIYEKVF